MWDSAFSVTLSKICAKSYRSLMPTARIKCTVFEAIELMFETLIIRKVGWYNYVKISQSVMYFARLNVKLLI